MIVSRAPMRISFVGGGTDLPDFYKRYPGRVISTAIDKFVYAAVNKTPLVKKVSVRYSVTETVDHAQEIKNTRVRAALLDLGIANGLEIATFAQISSKSGLGSSSSFSAALLKSLYTYLEKKVDKKELAEAACRLEINLVGEPIGKQDQYAAVFGGLNVIQFNPDGNVSVEPVLLDHRKRLDFEDRILLFFTGITREASSVLTEQKANIDKKFETLKEMADSVYEFRDRLIKADFKGLGEMLHQGWLKKKSLASSISNSVIDDLYNAGMTAGAWGGKVLGAGGGGCVMFLAPLDKKQAIREAMVKKAQDNKLGGFVEIPMKFSQSGTEVLFSTDHQFNTTLS